MSGGECKRVDDVLHNPLTHSVSEMHGGLLLLLLLMYSRGRNPFSCLRQHGRWFSSECWVLPLATEGAQACPRANYFTFYSEVGCQERWMVAGIPRFLCYGAKESTCISKEHADECWPHMRETGIAVPLPSLQYNRPNTDWCVRRWVLFDIGGVGVVNFKLNRDSRGGRGYCCFFATFVRRLPMWRRCLHLLTRLYLSAFCCHGVLD